MASAADLTSSQKENPGSAAPERFLWVIDDAESARLTTLLGFDFATLDIGGTYVTIPKLSCHRCRKLSGLDDFVASALNDGIHDKEFIIKVLKGEGAKVQASPPHKLRCMNCKTYYMEPKKQDVLFDWNAETGDLAVAGWATGFPFEWIMKRSNMEKGKGEPAVMGWATGHGFDWTVKQSDMDKNKGEPAVMG